MAVKVIAGALPTELFHSVAARVNNGGWRYGWRSNPAIGHGQWNQDYTQAGPENGLDVSAKLDGVLSEAWQHLRPPSTVLLRCYANGHTYGTEGYPHTDSTRLLDRTLVIYTVREWRREWGGETTVYAGSQILHAELPAPNNGLEFDGRLTHAARGVTRICPTLRTTLMFKWCPAGVDPLRDAVQIMLRDVGAYRKAHTDRNLAHHLLNTYDLLKAAGRSQTECAAGAAHSLFGTNAFKNGCLEQTNEAHLHRLSSVIGKEAAALALLFGRIQRPSTLLGGAKLALRDGGLVEVSPQELESLQFIEAANLVDQGHLSQWPALQKLWNSANP